MLVENPKTLSQVDVGKLLSSGTGCKSVFEIRPPRGA
jgi:hypothetical protein